MLELRRAHLTDRAFTQLSAGLPQLHELLLHDMHVCSFTNSNAAVVGGRTAGVYVRACERRSGGRHV